MTVLSELGFSPDSACTEPVEVPDLQSVGQQTCSDYLLSIPMVLKLCFEKGKKRMACLRLFNTRWTNFMIIFLCMGILPMENVLANEKHEGCQGSQCTKGDENVITKGASNEAISKGEILRSTQNDTLRYFINSLNI